MRALSFLLLLLWAAPAMAQQFEFVPTPHQGLNRIYRIDRITGEFEQRIYGRDRKGGDRNTAAIPTHAHGPALLAVRTRSIPDRR
mgnify:CR=1 FL=1